MKIFKNIPTEFIDVRGAITKILDDGKTNIKSILLITSKKDAIRANHYHQKDTHYCYLLSGSMEYHEKPIEGSEIETALLKAGDMVFTPAMQIHAMKFLEDSVFLALATESRSQEDYESDTVRVKFIE
jgi:quercetin dioxygenase-like cupin family protein